MCRGSTANLNLSMRREKAGVRVVAPMLAIETVAAGGGSICCVRRREAGGRAGQARGPIRDRRATGGVGRWRDRSATCSWVGLLPNSFRFRRIARRWNDGWRSWRPRWRRRPARSWLTANWRGAFSNRQREHGAGDSQCDRGQGVRPRGLFAGGVWRGGAAARLAVARESGIKEILVHPDASIFSAHGIGLAECERYGAEGVYRRAGELTQSELGKILERAGEQAVSELAEEGFHHPQQIELRHSLDVRYQARTRR